MDDVADGNFSLKRLVIFGCGYVGSEVAREALARGVQVVALTRNKAKAQELRQAGVEVVVADLAGDEWHEQIGGGPDFVLNAVSSGGGGLDGYRRSYVEGMRSVMAWAAGRGSVGTFVYTSSTSVYPQGGGVSVDEDTPTAGASERGRVLLEAEQLLTGEPDACRRWFVLRLAGIYGPGRVNLIEQVRTGTVAGRGDHHLNLIHRDDVCAAIWAAFGARRGVASGIFNVADDDAAVKSEVAGWLARRLGVAPPVFSGVPMAGRNTVTPDRLIANDRIKRVLGWRPRFASFREGYENVLAGGAK